MQICTMKAEANYMTNSLSDTAGAVKIIKIYEAICQHILSLTKLNPFNSIVIYGNLL